MARKAGRVLLGTVIDEAKYSTLESMLKSTDKADHEVARQLLNSCDVQKSIYWIWRLTTSCWISSRNGPVYRSSGHSHNMLYLRTKASRELRDACEFYTIRYLDAEEFAHWLIGKGWLTPEIFMRLRAGILVLIAHRSKNKFFDVYVQTNADTRIYDPDTKPEVLYKKEQNE